MPLNLTKRNEMPVIEFIGRFDYTIARGFPSFVDPVLATRPPVLAFDMSGVLSLDSAGLGALIKAVRTIKEQGGEIIIVSPQSQTMSMLALAGIDKKVTLASLEEFDQRFPPA